MKLALHFFPLVIIPLFAPAAGAQAKAVPKLPPASTVTGRVVTAADSVPLKSARVVLVPERSGPGSISVHSALTDADGRFKLEGIPAGRYRFFASHNGYVDQQFQSTGAEKGAVLALKPGEDVKDVLFRMTLAAVITGRVDDEDGQPMANIQVVALKRPSEDEKEDNFFLAHAELSAAAGGQTDDRGQYRLFGLKGGEYYIRAIDHFTPSRVIFSNGWDVHEALGSEYAPVYYPGITQLSQAEAVLVRPGDEAEADFILRRVKTVEVSGKAIGADGKPATNCYVGLIETPPTEFSLTHTANPDSKGEFKMQGIPPGSYLLMAEQDSSSDDSKHHASAKIEVGDENIDAPTLYLGRGTTISGRVTPQAGDMNMERLYVYLDGPDGFMPGGWANVKKDGSFQIADLPDGTFLLDIGGLEEGYYVRSARVGRDDLLTDGLRIEKGGNTGSIQVVLATSSALLEGIVTLNGNPAVAARVRATVLPETPYNRTRARSTTTDQNGHFSFPSIPPGRYKVVAKFSDSDNPKPARSDPQTIDISESQHRQTEIKVELPEK
jgi:protocatechuate 3,4-dioxygenase beta subunit